MTLGIVGVGEIGGRLAKIARHGFGMNVLGHQRRLDRLPAEAQPSALDELLRRAISWCSPARSRPQTRYLINQQSISLMKADAPG